MSLALQELFENLPAVNRPQSSTERGRYLRYTCSACDRPHKDEWDAERCCPPEEVYMCPVCDEEHYSLDEAQECEIECTSGQPNPTTCTVYKEKHSEIEDAVDCCLWKTMSYLERFTLARQISLNYHKR